MINIYSSLHDESGNTISGRTKLFVINTRENDVIGEFVSGVACIPEKSGTMFIVDDWLIPQIDKVQFKDGVLSVKESEELIPPVKTEKQLRMEELQRQMAELEAMPDEPTDVPLLDYTEEPTE